MVLFFCFYKVHGPGHSGLVAGAGNGISPGLYFNGNLYRKPISPLGSGGL